MKSYRFTSWLAVAACLLALGMVFWPLYARGHETMGQWGRHGIAEYLYGRQIGSRDPGRINCCLYAGDDGKGAGDCKAIPEENVKIVPGGYEWDGEFISHEDTNVSPQHPHTGEYGYYGCKHAKNVGFGTNPGAHCFFAPPRGM
jgi:hypothetical protein